ncbi:15904_t:CDS:2 [Acaulospora colombiana]|uniref:15904_t:CDS:1 n=1 Tax=Acaulospora colombiana TaxID=27376 RepID=A0ACA9N493_9GLOM|nr:15904_t:CDS:2 [Acaulospora colombiana]
MEDSSLLWDEEPPEYTLRANGSRSRDAFSSREQFDDGKPTADPTPGHPLLRDGKVLVYPKGFQCRKCLNKGFKPHLVFGLSFMASVFAPGDPQSPCKSCWEKYAQPYTRLLEEMNWLDIPTDANYQRPISRAGDHVNLNISANLLPRDHHRNVTPIYNSRVEYETPDDGKPTVSPCPGHPLLMSGNVLASTGASNPLIHYSTFKTTHTTLAPPTPTTPVNPVGKVLGATTGPSSSQSEASGHRLEDPSTEGKPTSRPLPGHPLLRDGMVLIYPTGYRCDQCMCSHADLCTDDPNLMFVGYNKGYTSGKKRLGSTTSALAPGDPKHPCTTCWDRYSRDYTDELASIDWQNDTSGTLQKPIYRFAPRFN